MSARGSRDKTSAGGGQGFTFAEAQIRSAARPKHDEMYAVESGEGSDHKDGSDASEALASDITDWSIDPSAPTASADTAAQALLEIKLAPSGNPRRPKPRNSLDKAKIATTPESGAAKSAEMEAHLEALLSKMEPSGQMQYKGWLAMHTAAVRDGLHDRAARADQRMAALEAKAFGDISTHTAAASSSGSSSGDSASMAAALAASAA